jgi:uncharacterized membrane protein HdeD (DUF308 family)
MEGSFTADVHKATTWSIALSVLMMVAGAGALFAPAMAGVAVTLALGWLLIFSGLLHFGFAWRASKASGAIWEILVGVVYGAIGFYLLRQPVLGLEALTLALSMYLVFEAILEFAMAFSLRPVPGSRWLLVDGVITLVLAVMIAKGWPVSSTWVIGTLVAISMFFSGLARLMASMVVRKIVA